MEEKILTPDQVAEKLQVHPFTVLKFIKQGKLKASKLGRVYRIRGSDVDQFLDNQLTRQEEKANRAAAKQPSKVQAKEALADQSVTLSEEKILTDSKEISPDSLHLGNESKENAFPDEIPSSEKKVSPKKNIPLTNADVSTGPKPDHYYILD